MVNCRQAVPVWIMPLAKVVENFEPGQSPFDVVIIDEASQSSVTELIAFYMGKQVVVVGDDKQVSPDAVGQDLTTVNGLIDEYLQGVPNRHLYDGKLSLYDLAAQSFGGVISLLEHFRCANDIIQFSNALSYDFKIRALRDTSQSLIKPHVVAHRVAGIRGENKTNLIEATEIASLIAAMFQRAEYDSKTIGVISLVGEEQAILIETILRQRLEPDAIEDRLLLCGNPAQFQGDERDVVFLSMVDSPSDGVLSLRAADNFKKRFNVAASRAKEQMWVVHSLNHSTDLQADDLRRRLIEHALDPSQISRQIEAAQQRAESEFERQVIQIMVARGYKVVSQWSVGAYRIDMVIVGVDDRLAVECDGEQYHTHDELERDIERQMVLERLGWKFERIRGSIFFRDAERAMKPIFDRLRKLGIAPCDRGAEAPIMHENQTSDSIRDLSRVAAEIRAKWEASKAEVPETIIDQVMA